MTTYTVTDPFDSSVLGSLRYGIANAVVNDYDTIDFSGDLLIAPGTDLPALTSDLTFSGGKLTLLGYLDVGSVALTLATDMSLYGLRDTGGSLSLSSGVTLTFDGPTDTSLALAISGDGVLKIITAGTLTLSGTNS